MNRKHEIQKFAEKMEESFKEFDNRRQGSITWNEVDPHYSFQQKITDNLKEISYILSGVSKAFKHYSGSIKKAGVQQLAIEIANYALIIYISHREGDEEKFETLTESATPTLPKLAILQCPKCRKIKKVTLDEVQEQIQFRGHWWSCDCGYWSETEYEKRHGGTDAHIYLELVGIVSATTEEVKIL